MGNQAYIMKIDPKENFHLLSKQIIPTFKALMKCSNSKCIRSLTQEAWKKSNIMSDQQGAITTLSKDGVQKVVHSRRVTKSHFVQQRIINMTYFKSSLMSHTIRGPNKTL